MSSSASHESSTGNPLLARGEAKHPSGILSNSSKGWVRWNTTSSPAGRESALMANDPEEGGVILFGGLNPLGPTYLNDTWLFHAGNWTELCTGGEFASRACPSSPPPQLGGTLAYDARDAELVLFGAGIVYGGGTFTDTWALRNGIWANLTSLARTPPASQGAMTYDATDGYVVFVAANGGTWTFDNDTWTHLNPPIFPSARTGEALFFDSGSGRVILWGGTDSQTWEYSGGNWTELNPLVAPPGGAPSGFGYDSEFEYGYVFAPSGVGNSTWFWGNGTWSDQTQNLSSAPPGGYFPGLAYDSTAGYSVLYVLPQYDSSGNETWVLYDPMVLEANVSASVRDVGQSVQFNASVYGGIPPYAFNFSDLPDGCEAPANITNSTSFTCDLTLANSSMVTLVVRDLLGTETVFAATIQVNPDPTTIVVISPNPTTVGVPVTFDGTIAGGSGPVSGHWTFGEGGSANGSAAVFTYPSPGFVLATFRATDAVGWTAQSTEGVQVNPIISLQATASRNVTDVGIPNWLNATGTGGTTPLTYFWHLGDGNSSTKPDTSHAYSTAGTFDARIWANDSVGASANGSVGVRVNPALQVSAVSNSSHAITGAAVQFSCAVAGGTAPYTYWWDFGGLGTNSSASARFTFYSPRTYEATLVVNDSVGGSRTIEVAVDIIPATNLTVPANQSSVAPGYSLWTVAGVGLLGVVIGAVIGVSLSRIRKSEGRPSPEPSTAPGPQEGATDEETIPGAEDGH
jgi:hypothetical protein